ncbi:unnamed protein product [Polarella glacialis]|uniref:CRAL-TRIO domain-containing protein n=1 Tax=Polarella glacialis TaxID=89957 RepID=A0A813FWP6_POLGL|nr:unnamed protein product [Polarella glacialis]CAE8698013.1 unnamed protein product [Polarella glacialis]
MECVAVPVRGRRQLRGRSCTVLLAAGFLFLAAPLPGLEGRTFFGRSPEDSKAKAQRIPLSADTGEVSGVAVSSGGARDAPSAVNAERLAAEVIASFPDGAAHWITGAHVGRMLVATDGDGPLAVAKLKEAVAWKRDTLDGWLAAEAERLPTAETRVIAIGGEGRPMVYSGCVNQRKGEIAGILLGCVWHRALEDAGPRAQLDYILDAHGYQPLLNLNIMPYLKIARSLNSYFAERFHQIIIIDVPQVLVWVIKAILPLLPAETRAKLKFVQRSKPEQMEELYNLCADEEMRQMVTKLLEMNKASSSSDGREATHELTRLFLESQRLRGSQR